METGRAILIWMEIDSSCPESLELRRVMDCGKR
jgi:hypothetical protein